MPLARAIIQRGITTARRWSKGVQEFAEVNWRPAIDVTQSYTVAVLINSESGGVSGVKSTTSLHHVRLYLVPIHLHES